MVSAEQNYHMTEQEMLAVIEALKAFCCYVDGIPCNLITAHQPNTCLDTNLHCSSNRLAAVNTALQFHMGISGRTSVADPLSHNPSYRPATSLVAHALRAQLCVRTRLRTPPMLAATPVTPPEPALQTQDGPWGDSLPFLTL